MRLRITEHDQKGWERIPKAVRGLGANAADKRTAMARDQNPGL